MNTELENITPDTFARFGSILEFPADVTANFHIVVREEKSPWRLALLRFNQHCISCVENHPDTMESFEPLAGAAVLLLAEHDYPENIRAFFLDKPVCLFKGIWHAVLALSEDAKVKITENLNVSTEKHNLEKPIRVYAGN